MKNVKNKFLEKINNVLIKLISRKEHFVKNPETDFSRTRKTTMLQIVKLVLCLSSGSLKKEVYENFGCDISTITTSAFIQQNDKILPEFYKCFFYEFTDTVQKKKHSINGYSLVACDGTAINIRTDPNDKETYIKESTPNGNYNAIHMTVFFDIDNQIYLDIDLQNGVGDEVQSFIKMLDHGKYEQNTIFIADRGFESYNLIAHIEQKGQYYLIRIKDVTAKRGSILATYNFPDDEEFDVCINPILTNKKTNFVKSNKQYKTTSTTTKFDFLDKEHHYYPMSIRVVRIEVKPGKYECIATNLPENQFTKEDIKELYFKRWKVETSFCDAKCTLSLDQIHFKKLESIYKEIYAKVTMYNYCREVANATPISKPNYQANMSLAVYLCRKVFRHNDSSIDVIKLLQRDPVIIKQGRSCNRVLRNRRSDSCQHRAA